ncbi:MAG TPA: hypothetical protein H9829_04935 [Candidatus Tetragenococcus pullicola]|nr:hypothetical protein [Candidatus Tetragenococcus pullicola]
MKNIYLILTDTGTVLSNCIKLYTKDDYNHASLALDPELHNVYSFGRKQLNNPFIGGFVKEDFNQEFFSSAKCQIYQITLDQEQLEIIYHHLIAFKLKQNELHYNFLGLLGIALKQNWHRSDAYFCSQFIAYLLEQSTVMHFSKPCYLMTPTDLVQNLQTELVYEGLLANYLKNQNSEVLTVLNEPFTNGKKV